MEDGSTPFREIPLVNGRGVALVDAADYERVGSIRWHLHSQGYAHTRIGRKTRLLHHFVLDVPPGTRIDHKNHNKLDCRRENLRLATQQQNLRNRRRRSNASSQYKGLSWNKVTGRWNVMIDLGEGAVHIGVFALDEEELAARTYDAAARFHFGEFACTNFPDGPATSVEELRAVAAERASARVVALRKSRFPGVIHAKDKKARPWRAWVRREDGSVKNIGYYATDEEAARAREAYLTKLPE